MKKTFIIIFLFILASCSYNKEVYWCGDHPCINKKEKESYFKKTMIVEIKGKSKDYKKKDTQLETITKNAKLVDKKKTIEEKDLQKSKKLEIKRRIKEEKKLAKQLKIEEKKRIKEEKELAKQLEIEEKSRIQEEKKLVKKTINHEKNIEINQNRDKLIPKSNEFTTLVEKIGKRQALKRYPDINNIPE